MKYESGEIYDGQWMRIPSRYNSSRNYIEYTLAYEISGDVPYAYFNWITTMMKGGVDKDEIINRVTADWLQQMSVAIQRGKTRKEFIKELHDKDKLMLPPIEYEKYEPMDAGETDLTCMCPICGEYNLFCICGGKRDSD